MENSVMSKENLCNQMIPYIMWMREVINAEIHEANANALNPKNNFSFVQVDKHKSDVLKHMMDKLGLDKWADKLIEINESINH